MLLLLTGYILSKKAASAVFISAPEARYQDWFLVGFFCLSRKCDSSFRLIND
jgi:hypothetical protein